MKTFLHHTEQKSVDHPAGDEPKKGAAEFLAEKRFESARSSDPIESHRDSVDSISSHWKILSTQIVSNPPRWWDELGQNSQWNPKEALNREIPVHGDCH